jgi:hypothetical protein
MPQPHRSLTALPAVAATAAAVALVSGCSSSAPTSEQHPSISFGSQVSTTPGMVGQGTPASPAPGTSHTESSTAPPVPRPGAGEPVVFERNIKPLFRQKDRESMTWAFDLWSYTDVKSHAAAIVERLRGGSMPCDGAWSAEKINVFQRWIDSGMAPKPLVFGRNFRRVLSDVGHRSLSKTRPGVLAERKPLPCSPASPPTPAP